MIVPVSNVKYLGNFISSVYYNTERNEYKEGKYCVRELPVLDAMSYEVSSGPMTVVGKDYSTGMFIVSYGDRLLYCLSKEMVSNASNIKVTRDGKFRCIDGKLEDMGNLFPDKRIEFRGLASMKSTSSSGIAKKFYAKYNGMNCVVKFKKLDERELVYEWLYKRVGDLLGIPVCRCYLSNYSGMRCIVSIFEYTDKDVFVPFKSLGSNIGELYSNLDEENRRLLDSELLLDYLMSQQDRHLGNLALVNERVYPLYDNGECLGVGVIGHFSNNFRMYIERKDKGYLRGLVGNLKKLEAIKCKYSREVKLIECNYRRLFNEK